MKGVVPVRLEADNMDEASGVHRSSFDDRMPWLAGLHTQEEDRIFYRERVFPTCEVWGAGIDGTLVGIIAFRADWIDHLYVLPGHQGRGFGRALVGVAKGAFARLHLWTFRRNTRARAFYEAQGFSMIRETDGAGNEEKEPDALFLWSNGSP